jgi:hypothetical protein
MEEELQMYMWYQRTREKTQGDFLPAAPLFYAL